MRPLALVVPVSRVVEDSEPYRTDGSVYGGGGTIRLGLVGILAERCGWEMARLIVGKRL